MYDLDVVNDPFVAVTVNENGPSDVLAGVAGEVPDNVPFDASVAQEGSAPLVMEWVTVPVTAVACVAVEVKAVEGAILPGN